MTKELVILITRVVKIAIGFHMDSFHMEIKCEMNISHVRFVYARI